MHFGVHVSGIFKQEHIDVMSGSMGVAKLHCRIYAIKTDMHALSKTK